MIDIQTIFFCAMRKKNRAIF